MQRQGYVPITEDIAYFESMISTNMRMNNIQNYNQYVKYHNMHNNKTNIHNKIITIVNPDDEDSIMIGVLDDQFDSPC